MEIIGPVSCLVERLWIINVVQLGDRWRHNIDSPSVEVAVDELTKCLIDEWVTNLWYSSLTPDQEFPEELRLLINNVIGELARRVKRVDLMALICR
jgi:sorting nexin-13